MWVKIHVWLGGEKEKKKRQNCDRVICTLHGNSGLSPSVKKQNKWKLIMNEGNGKKEMVARLSF